MQNVRRSITGLLALTLVAGACLAQEADKSEPQKFYRLDFVVKELEGGKIVNARAYFMTVATPGKDQSEIRTGNQVPIETGPGQWTLKDIGTNFDCHLIKEVPSGISLMVAAEVTNMLDASTGGPGHPIFRRNQWHSTVILPIKKPTVIFSSDDLASKRQMQVELTATPIN